MVIPAGSIVNVHFFSMFRSDWIADAETYDPDRWLDTNEQLPQLKEMFIPFSAGKRNCIGQNHITYLCNKVSIVCSKEITHETVI